MPTPWVSWRRILSCKQESHAAAVYDPKANCSTIVTCTPSPSPTAKVYDPSLQNSISKSQTNTSNYLQAKKRRSTSSSPCCNDLKNVVHGNTRVVHRGDQDSPLSQHYSIPNQLKVLLHEPSFLCSPNADGRRSSHHSKKSTSCYDCSVASCELPDLVSPRIANNSLQREGENASTSSTCHKCGESIADGPDALEEHHVAHHAVTELKEGESASSIVELIFQSSWLLQSIPYTKPYRIFKVHNSPRTTAKFEEYREMVKTKAAKISKKHSRCLVDGNELLRFYCTTVACDMGSVSAQNILSMTSSLCSLTSCGVCQILKHGFPMDGQPGIYTNASSSQAHESFMLTREHNDNRIHAMLVCRVIAGRIKKSGYESSQEGPASGYDSVAGESGSYTDLDELMVFNNKAVLPCFIVVYSC
ncbi:hypothetical protein KP509_32G006400 [Ceratopteris richardii]|uniref:C2H2-type domain-containing protein n=1 Tax=Ceratopteris richardii TaxID=49495 RepID=A0A8T2QSU4_CERRI|nr:hypothetical protein KP509_32G006400 [Ceratopteris richardii]